MAEQLKNSKARLFGNLSIGCPLLSFLSAIISPFLWDDKSSGHTAGVLLIFVAVLIFLIGCFLGLLFGLVSLSLNKDDKVVHFAAFVNSVPLAFVVVLFVLSRFK